MPSNWSKLPRRMRRLLQAYASASVDYSWRGAGDPDDYDDTKQRLATAREKLAHSLLQGSSGIYALENPTTGGPMEIKQIGSQVVISCADAQEAQDLAEHLEAEKTSLEEAVAE